MSSPLRRDILYSKQVLLLLVRIVLEKHSLILYCISRLVVCRGLVRLVFTLELIREGMLCSLKTTIERMPKYGSIICIF